MLSGDSTYQAFTVMMNSVFTCFDGTSMPRLGQGTWYLGEKASAKQAELNYRQIGKTDRYWLVEVELLTGRHHQIRCQLASIGCPIKGDLKYGAKRSNPDGSISLHARSVEFTHPVSKEHIKVIAPVPQDPLWQSFEE